jgi:regulator of RNase E activity RraB
MRRGTKQCWKNCLTFSLNLSYDLCNHFTLGVKEMNISITSLIVLAIAGVLIYSRLGASAELSLDGQVIQQLKKAGSNIDKPHNIEFFFYFPTLDAAEKIATTLNAEGFTAKAQPAAKGNDFVVLATKSMVPSDTELTALRQKFNAMSAAEKGDYDGWGSPVVK